MAYPNINMVGTGKRLKQKLETAGFTPKTLQAYLHLSCVQPIYRWYKGSVLPSVENLLALSELLGVHMEELLVKNNVLPIHYYDIEWSGKSKDTRHLLKYWERLYKDVA